MKRILLSAVIAMGFWVPPAPSQAQSNPYVGQMINVGFNFCPRAWAAADGTLLAISSNDALFSLIGTFYGGDGRTTFALPDLRGRTVVHQNPSASPTVHMGQRGGQNATTLIQPNLPSHTHTAASVVHANSQAATGNAPGGFALAGSQSYTGQRGNTVDVEMLAGSATTAVNPTGGNQQVNITDPFLGTRWCIALFGTYPSRS